MSVGLCAQTQVSADTIVAYVGDDTIDQPSQFSVKLGVSAGTTLFVNDNSFSPYYSKYGFTLEIPLLWEYNFAPHWQFSTGIRYDFNWDPLYNAVEEIWYNNGDEPGLALNTNPSIGSQHGRIQSSFIGLPLKITWYPKANDKRLLGIGLDYYIGFAVSNLYSVTTEELRLTDVVSQSYSISSESIESSSLSLCSWRMELGITLTTDYLGLVHGVRLFFDLLPRYEDPLTEKKIRTSGLTFFL